MPHEAGTDGDATVPDAVKVAGGAVDVEAASQVATSESPAAQRSKEERGTKHKVRKAEFIEDATAAKLSKEKQFKARIHFTVPHYQMIRWVLLAVAFIANEKTLGSQKLDDIIGMAYGGRYVLLLNGLRALSFMIQMV